MSPLERLFLSHARMVGLPEPMQEWEFHSERKWRLDFAWPEYKLALEVEGGQHVRGRHNRAQGYAEDARKYNEAQIAGWRVLRATGDMVRNGEAIRAVIKAFQAAKGEP